MMILHGWLKFPRLQFHECWQVLHLLRNQTFKRVKKVIVENNYEPSELARSLTTKKTNTIGVVIDELANPFFIEVAKYIEPILYNNGYLMLLCSSSWDEDKEFNITKALVSRRVDGILLASTSLQLERLIFLLNIVLLLSCLIYMMTKRI